jgi:hypothetical protein
MAGSIPAARGRIFISYRREETAYPAGWLYDRLAARFADDQVFKDVDSIELGDDFVEVISSAVGSCDVLLALIGDRWLTITDEDGRRRLDDPNDFVRVEIEAALTRNVRVIPILVEGARMPRAEELPDSLARLVRRQALELSPARFDFDTGRLLKVLDKTLAEVWAAQQDAASTVAPAGKAPGPSTTKPPETPARWEQVERSPAPRIPPAAPATPAAAQPPSDSGKPPGPSATALPKASQRWEQAERSPAPSIPPAAPATPAWPSPSEEGKPPGKQRRHLSTRARVLAGAGIGVVLILVIVAIVANSGTTPPPTGAVTTSSPTQAPLFEDNFSSRAFGWEDAGKKPIGDHGGYYKNGAYRFYSEPVGIWAAHPENASTVYPSAPPDLRIEVDARRLAGDQEAGYGISCRSAEDSGYAFLIGDKVVGILKITAASIENLVVRNTQTIDADATSQLQAECTAVEGQQAVHLVFSVNNHKYAEVTDTKNPLLTGTVGLGVATGNTKSASAVEAEFDNLVVTQL